MTPVRGQGGCNPKPQNRSKYHPDIQTPPKAGNRKKGPKIPEKMPEKFRGFEKGLAGGGLATNGDPKTAKIDPLCPPTPFRNF